MSSSSDVVEADRDRDPPRIVAGKKCYVENGERWGWFVSSTAIDGPEKRGGYEYYRVGNKSIAEHRVLAFAWGMIDSVYADVEVDHVPPDGHSIPLRWLNIEPYLQPVDGQTNTNLAVVRNAAHRVGQTQLGLDGRPV